MVTTTQNPEAPAEPAGPSASVWRFARANRAKLIIDADAYFELVRDAMCRAERRIFLIGWDFDTRMLLSGGRRWWHYPKKGRYPARLGSFIVWLAKQTRGLEIRILKWNFTLFSSLFRGTMALDLIRWTVRPQIKIKYDSAHPIGCSHHQKIVIIDDSVAVCGGIDMAKDRWDTRAHLHEDPRRRLPRRKSYGPWHDVTMMMEGEIAASLSDMGRERWQAAGGRPLEPCLPGSGESAWPERLRAEFENVEIGIARTRAAYNGIAQVTEIEALFVEHIARAKRFVYAETQYFASRRIAEAIAERLDEPDPPEFLIINPRHADGWLQREVMDSARVRLVRSLEACDHAGRFRIFAPYTSGGTPIYVHAKLMIVDDEILRVGSANMNNRSMGLDSECDVFLDAARPANAHIGPAVTRVRHSLLAEHCGISAEEIGGLLDRFESMSAMIDSLPRQGKHLAPLPLIALNGVEKALADSAILDPERPGDWFEPIHRRGLFRRWGRLHRPD